jgi:hypothetical protein
VSKDEVYSGLLLVYINIARYAGPAACDPPSRFIVDTLFDACDLDKSGNISEDEFVTIMIILSSQLTWRTAMYYAFLILMLPCFVDMLIRSLSLVGLDTILEGTKQAFDSIVPGLDKVESLVPAWFWEQLPGSSVSFVIFSAIVPFCWGKMDDYFKGAAEKKGERNLNQNSKLKLRSIV